jgi:hypothetical protein
MLVEQTSLSADQSHLSAAHLSKAHTDIASSHFPVSGCGVWDRKGVRRFLSWWFQRLGVPCRGPGDPRH